MLAKHCDHFTMYTNVESLCSTFEINRRCQFYLNLEKESEKGMATHSNILAWEIPWTEEPWWARVHEIIESNTTE